MPAEFDWRDLPHAEHEDTDPLARFRPEKRPESAPQRPQRPSQSKLRRVAVLLAVASALAFAAAYVWSRRAPHDAQAPTPAPPVANVATTSVEPEPLPPPARPSTANVPAPTSSAVGATALSLAAEGGAFSPSFAATGSTLFFHTGPLRDTRLVRTDLNGNGPSVTIVAGGSNFHARPSPDGSRIAFDSDRDGQRAVYIAASDGSRIQRVSGSGYAELPSWSPDGEFLAFVRGEPRRPRIWNLWIRDLRTSTLQRVTAFRSGQTWTAAWFPDGRRVAFTHDDLLIVLDITDGRSQTFRSPARGSAVRTPAVSPDGRRVIFQVTRSGVWLLDLRTRAMKLVQEDKTAEEFAWTPDGTRVAYHSRRDGEWRIWMAPVPP